MFGNSANDTLFSLVLNLGSPELLDGGSQTVRSGVQIQKTEHGEERHNQVEDLEGLSQMLQVNDVQKHNGSAVITPHVAHTDASMQRVQNTHNIVDRNLSVNAASYHLRKERRGPERRKWGKEQQRSAGSSGRSSREDWWNRLDVSQTNASKQFQRPTQRFAGFAGDE